jgi:hypothetical protein
MHKWLILFCSLLAAPVLAGQDSSFCHDEDTRAEWQAIVAEHADDPDWQYIHALWLGLCAKVDMGDISEGMASIFFERERERLTAKKKADPLPPVERYLYPQG